MNMNAIAMPPRLILVHKQKTSARLRYLRHPAGLLFFDPLPAGCSICSDETPHAASIHPAGFLRQAEERLALPADSIEPVPDFFCWAAHCDGDIPIILGAFTSIDPPFATAEALGGKFIAITEARQLSEVDREVMRRTYEYMIG
jgi:hypothetical protein